MSIYYFQYFYAVYCDKPNHRGKYKATEITNMIRISIFLVLGIFSSIPYTFTAALEVTDTALSLFSTITDLFETSTENDDYQELTRQLSDFKHILNSGLSSLILRLEKSTFQNALTGYVNTIDSCETDYLNYVTGPSDASMKNILKCSSIMESVRPLGKFLSGKTILDELLLFDLYKNNDGICNGSAMESIYKTLFADYVIGCTVATLIEMLENGANTKLYANECKDIMYTIMDYVKSLYRKCASMSCRNFHFSVETLFRNGQISSSSGLHKVLTDMYPWFNFLVFKLLKGGKVTTSGNFFIGQDGDHWNNGYQYDILFFDANLEITSEKTMYSLIIEIHDQFYKDSYFGNSTMRESLEILPFRTFRGFATVNNEFCTNHSHLGEPPYRLSGISKSSGRRNIGTSTIFLFIFLSVLYNLTFLEYIPPFYLEDVGCNLCPYFLR